MGRRIAAAGLAAVLVVGCGRGADASAALADDICSQLQEASTPLERRVAQQELMETMEADAGEGKASFVEVLTAMGERCPTESAQLLGAGAQDHDVRLTVEGCRDNKASGTVTNEGDTTVTVRVGVRIVDGDDTLLDTSSTLVDGLEPGQKGRWEAYHSVDDAGFTCKGEVEQVTPQ